MQISLSEKNSYRFPITYSSDTHGMIRTQAIFREEREYLLRVLSANREVHRQWLKIPEKPSPPHTRTSREFTIQVSSLCKAY
jgi:hypothetical protein